MLNFIFSFDTADSHKTEIQHVDVISVVSRKLILI